MGYTVAFRLNILWQLGHYCASAESLKGRKYLVLVFGFVSCVERVKVGNGRCAVSLV